MKESICSNTEVGDTRSSGGIPSRHIGAPAKTNVQEETSTGSSRQLMCSQDPTEIEAVKAELSRVGIITETRINPTAEALGVTGVELWVKHEGDLPKATNLCAKIRARSRTTPANSKGETHKLRTGLEVLQAEMPIKQLSAAGDYSNEASELRKLEEDSSLLDEQIEEMLDFQREVLSQGVALRGRTKALRQALAERQVALSREDERRAAARDKQAEEISGLQRALQRERMDLEQIRVQLEGERAKSQKAEEQLRNERQAWAEKSMAHGDALKKAQEKLDLQARLLQTHTAAVLKLTKEVATLEAQISEDQKSLSKLREDLAMERRARVAAEQRAESAPTPSSLHLPSLLRRFSGKKATG